MTAAKDKYPKMRRGTYFSLPEWYHPDYAEFGFGSSTASVIGHEADGTPIIQKTGWPGGEAHNAYNSSGLEPYTGYVKSPTNYIVDIQGPQMKSLFNDYGTEVLWYLTPIYDYI
jgi:alpha-L-fucosidase